MHPTQKIRLVLKSDEGVETEDVTALPYEFKMSNRGKWEMLVADEDASVRKGEISRVMIRDVHISPNTIVLPCAFSHHALGAVVKVQHRGLVVVEAERHISSVQFLGYEDGMVKNGDLLAVVNVFPITLPEGARRPC
ncbi:MAG TPA: DUF22 domain-containing protein [Candidatus Methanoperedenaceae archaeon]|nr:DUF22 domain-containing protein [Candidatus Methanoperedenaceae archaeon]